MKLAPSQNHRKTSAWKWTVPCLVALAIGCTQQAPPTAPTLEPVPPATGASKASPSEPAWEDLQFVSTTLQSDGQSRPPLNLQKHQRIAFVGNSLAERMNLFGNFETLLHSRFSGVGTQGRQLRLAGG